MSSALDAGAGEFRANADINLVKVLFEFYAPFAILLHNDLAEDVFACIRRE